MNNLYVKNGVVKRRTQIVICKEDKQVYNPSEDMLLEEGWSVYAPPVCESVALSAEEQYKQRIIDLIRERYSVDDEIAILRQRDSKPEEFNTYNIFVEDCKTQAREELGL